MKPHPNVSLLVIGILLMCSSFPLDAQETNLPQPITDDPIYNCQYEAYKHVLDSFLQLKIDNRNPEVSTRASTKDFDIRIYIDTSYERRRTGGYNSNDSVVHYLNNVVTGVQSLFNLAAPNWDVIIKVEYVFFDGATPFSYGSNIAETLINFYDWLDSQGYPGSNDNYVFYSGNYTNQGVSFLGALCFPGGSLVGYISSKTPNEDLASHEWIGHCAGSNHYNSEVNIMNSIAQRPWNTPSIDVIETFLNAQNCVENAQSPLDLSISDFEILNFPGYVKLRWKYNASEKARIYIEKKHNNGEWYKFPLSLSVLPPDGVFTYTDKLTKSGIFYYKVSVEYVDGAYISSPVRFVEIKEDPIVLDGTVLKNLNLKSIDLFDLFGRFIIRFNSPEFDLSSIDCNGPILIRADYFQQVISIN